MRPDPLHFLLRTLDEPDPVFPADAVDGWPAGAFDRLTGAGLLRPAANAEHVVCHECGEQHVVKVVSDDVGGRRRFFAPCPESLGNEIDAARLRQWKPDLEALVVLFRRDLGLHGRQPTVAAGRLWELGGVLWEGVKRKVLFAIGLHWADGGSIAVHVGLGGKPVVLVPEATPATEVWKGLAPPVVPLTQVVENAGDRLKVDIDAILGLVREVDQLNSATLEGALASPKLRSIARRAVKQEMKATIPDEAYAAAYVQTSSIDKAAAELSRLHERSVNRYQVYRAVTRLGLIKKVRETESSQSVVRRVALRGRNNRKNK